MNMTSAFSRTAPGSAVIDVAGTEELNQSVAVQADGKVLVAGFSAHDGVFETTYDYSVVRLNANGTLDTAFGDNGRALIDAQVSLEEEKYSLAVQGDGSILVSSPYFGGPGNYDVIRMSTSGVLDARFNANAQASIPDSLGRSYGAVSVAEDGAVLVTTVDPDNLNLVRLKADGTPDTRFGDHGYLTFASPVEWGSDAVQVRVLANGQLLVACNLFENEFPYAVMRVNTDGSLDTRFGHNGMVTFDSSLLSYGDGGITVQADGKVVLSGNSYEYNAANIVRLNADGSYDASFGTGGVVSVPLQGEVGSMHSVTVLADGKIIVGGDTDSNYSVIRLNTDGTLDTPFASPDGKNHLDGSPGDDALPGLNTAETIQGFAGADVLQGNHGRDLLSGGEGGDLFRFASVGDSYRTEVQAASDRVLDFNPGEDLIDLRALGFTGIGNGHDGTVVIKANAAGTYTYLKNYDADGNGHRFELSMAGDLTEDLSERNLMFAASPAAASITTARDSLMSYTNRVDWYGTPGNDAIDDFYGLNDVIYGGAGNDTLAGGIKEGSTTVLIGGEGRDLLESVSEHNTFRFSSMTDSFRTSLAAHSDTVDDFDVANDTLDFTALGFTGLGNGHGSTLRLMYDQVQNITYLKSFDEDTAGRRFELVLNGNYSTTLTSDHFQPLVAGTAHNDHLAGSTVEPVTLEGYAGRDSLSGATADERLDGGAGGDTLSGGAGADAFVFSHVSDSVTFNGTGGTGGRDLITDFSASQGDTIDLSQLGYSGFGNGHDGTLKVSVNAAGDKTALKSLDTDSAGNHFEIMFNGHLSGVLDRDTVIFANTSGNTIVDTLTRDDQEIVGSDNADVLVGAYARDEILGFAGDDIIDGGTGRDSMAGGKGADTLTGGAAGDDFVFYSIAESYRTATQDHSDLITDYGQGDVLYALDLGFTEIGDGTEGTLRLDYDKAAHLTYLHSLEADDKGRFFQVTLAGEHKDVSIALDGLYVDEPIIDIIGVDPTGPAPT
jgi:uncharacterized delta-60 repeat protein